MLARKPAEALIRRAAYGFGWLLLVFMLVLPLQHGLAQGNGVAAAATSGDLLSQIQHLRTEVADAERRIAAYRDAHPLIADASVLEQQLAILLVQIAAADERETQRLLRIEAIETAIDAGLTTDTVTGTADSSLIGLLQAKNALLNERAELALTLRPAHPTMQALQPRIAAADKALAAGATRILDTLTAEGEQQATFRAAQQEQLTTLRRQSADAAKDVAALEQLERDAAGKRIELEFYMGEYMPDAPATQTIFVPGPAAPSETGGGWVEAIGLPVGIATAAIAALTIQSAILRRRHYRRGFDAGVLYAAEEAGPEQDVLAEWEEDSMGDGEPVVMAERQSVA